MTTDAVHWIILVIVIVNLLATLFIGLRRVP